MSIDDVVSNESLVGLAEPKQSLYEKLSFGQRMKLALGSVPYVLVPIAPLVTYPQLTTLLKSSTDMDEIEVEHNRTYREPSLKKVFRPRLRNYETPLKQALSTTPKKQPYLPQPASMYDSMSTLQFIATSLYTTPVQKIPGLLFLGGLLRFRSLLKNCSRLSELEDQMFVTKMHSTLAKASLPSYSEFRDHVCRQDWYLAHKESEGFL